MEYVCDHCHQGKMRPVRPEAHVNLVQPTSYKHECGKCGHQAQLAKLYPDIIYRVANTTVALLN